MATIRTPLALVILSLLGVACHKSGVDPCGELGGVVHRDVNAALIYSDDTDDWGDMDQWCPTVEALFADLPSVTWAQQPADSLWSICFPNPSTSNQLALGFYRNDTSRVDLRFTDAHHHLLLSVDSIMAQQFVVNTDPLGPPDGHLVRVYYRVTHADGTAHRGHGDIIRGS